MSYSPDDTQPTQPPVARDFQPTLLPPPQPDVPPYDPEAEPGGPGCVIWGVLGFVMVVLAGLVVVLAGFAGWSDGLRVAQARETQAQAAYVADQCERLAADLSAGSLGLAQRRFESLAESTPEPECVAQYAPTATALFMANQPTATPSPTMTTPAVATDVITATPEIQDEPQVVEPSPTTTGGFDLPALLQEARDLLTEGDRIEAIDLLEAIQAIDPTYEKADIDSLLFNALIREAEYHYRAQDGNLAQAILLTERAAEYGDIGNWAFERDVAQLYLSAQTYLNINFGEAIRLLNRVISLSPQYRDARTLLVRQYAAYGDALAQSDPCEAVMQYNNALNLAPSPNISTQRDVAQTNCDLRQSGTLLPPDQEGQPGVQTPIAPIGVPGT